MSWYKKAKIIDTNKRLRKEYLNELKKFSELDWKNQEGDWMMFGDASRYVMDAQAVKLFLSKTDNGWTISLMTNHAYLGTAQYSVFWRFNLDEESKARGLFKKVNKVVKETMAQFVKEEKPTSLFYPTLRNKIQNLNGKDMTHTNIPIINYSYDIDYSEDWDKNIYGPRYPKYKEESFDQYLNSSIYSKTNTPPTGKFAL